MDKYYGLDEDEHLFNDLDELLERIIDDSCNGAGEPTSVILGRLKFPIKVYVHKKMSVSDMADSIAERALEDALGFLDEEYSDPDGDTTEPTKKMKAAANAFGKAVVEDYDVWACEPTGEVLEYSREQFEEFMKDTIKP